jgi:hypothetical protein
MVRRTAHPEENLRADRWRPSSDLALHAGRGLEPGPEFLRVTARSAPGKWPVLFAWPMVADTKRELPTALGILHRTEGVPLRPTSVADPEGVIRFASVNDLSVGRGPGPRRAPDGPAVPVRLEGRRAHPPGRLSVSELDALRARTPETARDVRRNLRSGLLRSGLLRSALSEAQRGGVHDAVRIAAAVAAAAVALDSPDEATGPGPTGALAGQRSPSCTASSRC